MSQSNSAHGIQAVARAMRPKSVAIIGMSARPNSAGQNVFNGLKTNDFKGDIHLVGRSDEPINGLPVLKSAADLPQGVDLAVFCLPAAGVKEAVVDCVKAKVGSAVIFAAGFAEVGDRSVQQDVEKIAREGGLAII